MVPWKYNNPRISRKSMSAQQFIFQGVLIEMLQDTEAEVDVTKNTGLKLWDGAFLLARYLENKTDFPDKFWSSKRCVELGTGCGLVGLVAWLLNADVVLTDLEEILTHTRKCLDHNLEKFQQLGIVGEHRNTITTKSLLWGSEDCKKLNGPFDIILGSDIIYQPEYAEDLIKTLDVLSGDQTLILVSYKRRGLGEEKFFDILSEYSFCATEVSKDRHPPDFESSEYKIIKIKKCL